MSLKISGIVIMASNQARKESSMLKSFYYKKGAELKTDTPWSRRLSVSQGHCHAASDYREHLRKEFQALSGVEMGVGVSLRRRTMFAVFMDHTCLDESQKMDLNPLDARKNL